MPRRKLTSEERERSKQKRREKKRLDQQKYAATAKGKTTNLENHRKRRIDPEKREHDNRLKRARYLKKNHSDLNTDFSSSPGCSYRPDEMEISDSFHDNKKK
ncbi:hypothetical protein NPIL_694711 [Nephila pilipes]|uniref:Uncharacterized protein n=1 Tax=Nephila pilipes TaxID=299642 RepID=A0A8X6P8S1_NEPPI|nr:hypothetical protein NPIL_694711 [Nephila pilipes]